jgi:hypothetical protein
MAIQIVLILIIAALLGYIVFLHIRLTKKNIFIQTTFNRLSGNEKNLSMDEITEYLKEIKIRKKYSSYLSDKLPEGSSLNFILENDKDMVTYMHYTKEEADADNILKEGFKFVDSFYKTALPLSKDSLDLKMKHSGRKYYGDYIILISISNDIVNFYSMELVKAGIRNYTFENILTEIPPLKNENSDIVYQLSPRFIKGYINHRTGKIVRNPEFDPWYNSPLFMKNIGLLKNT